MSKILSVLLGVVIDKLIVPLFNAWVKSVQRAKMLKEKLKDNHVKVEANDAAKTKEEARDTFGKLP